MSELIPVIITYRDGAYRVSAPNWDGGEVYPRLEVDVTIASLAARVAGLEQICRDYLGGMEMAQNSAKRRGEKIADLIAQLSAMTQERDAHGAQRDEAEKRLMDCQYSLADLTAKLAAATDEIAMTQQELDDLDVWKERVTTAETALREALKFAKDLSDKYYHDYKRGDKRGDSYTEGKSDAADEIAIKIAALSAAPQTEAPQEVCICAAIKMPSGEVIHGHRHNHCYDVVRARTDAVREDIVAAEQGFVTSQNRFVGRKEAMRIQRESGLPSCYRKDGKYFGDELFSEDLYGEPPAQEKCPKCGGKGTICSVTGLTYSFCVCLDCDRGPVSTEVDCPACHGTGWKVKNG